MKHRYYSHYTYIEPGILLKDYIVELDDSGYIMKAFPFDREIEKTEFYSGLLVFLHHPENIGQGVIDEIKTLSLYIEKDIEINPEKKYKMFHFEDFKRNI